METYSQMRIRHQNEFNEFPLHCAFGEEQLKRKFVELGLDMEKDMDKIVVIKDTGCFILAKNMPAFEEMIKRHRQEHAEAIAGDKTGTGFIYQMFLQELRNYEFGYTGDATDALDALGYTLADIEADPLLKVGFEKAEQECYEQALKRRLDYYEL